MPQFRRLQAGGLLTQAGSDHHSEGPVRSGPRGAAPAGHAHLLLLPHQRGAEERDQERAGQDTKVRWGGSALRQVYRGISAQSLCFSMVSYGFFAYHSSQCFSMIACVFIMLSPLTLL